MTPEQVARVLEAARYAASTSGDWMEGLVAAINELDKIADQQAIPAPPPWLMSSRATPPVHLDTYQAQARISGGQLLTLRNGGMVPAQAGDQVFGLALHDAVAGQVIRISAPSTGGTALTAPEPQRLPADQAATYRGDGLDHGGSGPKATCQPSHDGTYHRVIVWWGEDKAAADAFYQWVNNEGLARFRAWQKRETQPQRTMPDQLFGIAADTEDGRKIFAAFDAGGIDAARKEYLTVRRMAPYRESLSDVMGKLKSTFGAGPPPAGAEGLTHEEAFGEQEPIDRGMDADLLRASEATQKAHAAMTGHFNFNACNHPLSVHLPGEACPPDAQQGDRS